MEFLIDNNISLELTAQHHAQGLFVAVDENREHLSTFLPWVSQMQTIENFKTYISNCQQLYSSGQEISFVIIKDKTIIGRIGIHHINPLNQYGEIGYWLVKSETGKGIISKSCRRLITHGFDQMVLHRIAIKAAVKNERSRKIPEKFGFVFEGILRQAEKVNGEFLDLAIYSMLKREWSMAL